MPRTRRKALPNSEFITEDFNCDFALGDRSMLQRLSSLMSQLNFLLQGMLDGKVSLSNSVKEISNTTNLISDVESRFSVELKARIDEASLLPQDHIYITKVGKCLFECSILLFDIESLSVPLNDEHECGYELREM